MKPGASPAPRARLLRCTGLSLLLHGALALPWLAAHWLAAAPQPVPQPLALDVLGMLSTRQFEQQSAHAAPAPTPARVKPVPRQAARQRDSASSPVPVQAAAALPPPDPTPAPTPAPAPADGGQQQQVQQTIQPPETEAALKQRYVIAMTKAIQSRLVYPAQAREAGHVGRPKIRFTVTEDGAILPGTLTVRDSSGYSLLDDYALRAAQASAPFGKPPKRMEVVIAVSFSAS